jgi:hypothetical protein
VSIRCFSQFSHLHYSALPLFSHPPNIQQLS